MNTMRTVRPRRDPRQGFRANHCEMEAILARVRDAGAEIPVDLWGGDGMAPSAVRERRKQLEGAIGWAFMWANIHRDLTDPSRARGRYARLDEVAKLAAKLALMLEDERVPVADMLASRFPAPKTSATLPQVLSGLRHLSSVAVGERQRLEEDGMHDRGPLTPPEGSNAQSLTAGDHLSLSLGEVFEEFLGLAVTFPQDAPEDGGDPYGPFVAFVMAVRAHMGAPVVAGSVKSEWMRARNKARQIGDG